MENPASHTDMQALGFPIEDDKVTVAQGWLNVTWRALRREVADLDERVASGALDVEDVIDVIVAATMRVMSNPQGNESESFQIDDYQESVKRGDATKDVYFKASELRRLLPVAAPTAGSFKYA